MYPQAEQLRAAFNVTGSSGMDDQSFTEFVGTVTPQGFFWHPDAESQMIRDRRSASPSS